MWVRLEERPRTSYPGREDGMDRDREAGYGTAGAHKVAGRAWNAQENGAQFEEARDTPQSRRQWASWAQQRGWDVTL